MKNNLNLCKLFISEFKRGKSTIHKNSTIYRTCVDIQYLQPSELTKDAKQFKRFLVATKYPGLSQVKGSNPSKCTL